MSPSADRPEPLYELRDVPGKGKGLIATRLLTPGTCIIDEPALFTTETLTNPSTMDKDLGSIVKALPRDDQRAFLSLHNNFPGQPSPFSNIVRSNGYPLGPSSEIGGIFLETARMNHSCLPNAQHAWNAKLARMLVHVVREIQAGQEITLSYILGGPSSVRQPELKTYFGFDCACELCSLPAQRKKLSDERLSKAQKLDAGIGDQDRVKRVPERALTDCRALLEIYRAEEILDLRLARLYYDAFQICALHSDAARASVFARREMEARIVCEGPDSVEAAKTEVFVEAPEKFEGFGATRKWKTDVSDRRDSEEWLWREKI